MAYSWAGANAAEYALIFGTPVPVHLKNVITDLDEFFHNVLTQLAVEVLGLTT